MSDLVDGFHHVGLITRSMQGTIARYERLGFNFTPLSLPRIPLQDGGTPQEIGAGNRTAIFAHNYLEVLAVTDPARWAQVSPEQRGPYDLDIPLARYEGLHVLHFNADDLEALERRVQATALSSSPIRPYQRMVDTPEGPQTMRALALSFRPDETPEALIQIAQHLTPELVLQPRLQTHPNGATDITAVTVCSPEPETYADRYQAMTGHPFTVDGDGASITIGAARIEVLSPAVLAKSRPEVDVPAVPSLVEVILSVHDLDATADLLAFRGVHTHQNAAAVSVPAAEACGATVTFTR